MHAVKRAGWGWAGESLVLVGGEYDDNATVVVDAAHSHAGIHPKMQFFVARGGLLRKFCPKNRFATAGIAIPWYSYQLIRLRISFKCSPRRGR
eukprot:3161974-Prymnesium_polylepis.1